MSRPLFVYRQLFAGHVVGSRPMKRKKNLLRMITSNSKMTTNMVKKRVRERSKLQLPPLGLSLRKLEGPCLVPRSHYSARHQSVSVPCIRHLSELTEKAWENAIQELGKERPMG